MEKLTLSRAKELLAATTTQQHLFEHAIGVSACMGAMAEHFGADAEYWQAVGYLHDYDFEQYPEEHLAHLRNEVEPKTDMEKSLFTVDELSGLIAATAKMRPGGVTDLEASSVRKKFKDKRFAAKINRELIQKGCDMLGMQLPEVIAICIGGMREHAEELGIGAKAE